MNLIKHTEKILASILFLGIGFISNYSWAAGTLPSTTAVETTEYLISVEELKSVLDRNKTGFVILELTMVEEYAKGHIPMAQNIWRTDYQAKDQPYKGVLPSKELMESLLGRLGISAETRILLYDDCGNVNSARFWWILNMYGHTNVQIIDGGKHGWTKAGFELESNKVKPEKVTYVFGEGVDKTLFITKDEVLEAMGDPAYLLLDVRTPDEFSGDMVKDGATKGGHISGSIFMNHATCVQYREKKAFGFKSLKDLKADFEDIGLDPAKKIIVYCHTGMRSSLTTFVLSQVLKFPSVQNYDGSWVEWSYFEDLPFETGMPPVVEKPVVEPVVEEAVASVVEAKAGYGEIIKNSYKNNWKYMGKVVTLKTDPIWKNFFYGLIILSLFFYGLEIIKPWRKGQKLIRKDFWIDIFYMFFNVFFFSLIVFYAFSDVLTKAFNSLLALGGLKNIVALQIDEFPVWAYFLILFVVGDFITWWVHRLLHRVSWLWEFHKVHHSVIEMGFAAHLRFHWMETIVYTAIKTIPLTMLGFNLVDLFALHVFNLAWGHFNHSNITVSGRVSGGVMAGLVSLGCGYLYLDQTWQIAALVVGGAAFGALVLGPFMKYIFNSPEMHIWHHAHEMPEDKKYGINFGITLGMWDYIFGTAHVPHTGRDIKLGFPGIDEFPSSFGGHFIFGLFKKKPKN